MTCRHAWTPTPADVMSALALVGRCQCIKCHAIATEADMRGFAVSGEVTGALIPWQDVDRRGLA